MSVPQRLFTSFAKIALLVSLATVSAIPNNNTLNYVLLVLNHIESNIFFAVDEPRVLAKSAAILNPKESYDLLTREEYIDFLQGELDRSGNPEKFFHKVMKSIVVSLPDPYAAFLTSHEVNEEKKQKNGESFTGFGLELAAKNGHVQIAAVVPGSAADNAGVYLDDTLVAVNGTPVHGLTHANELLQGDLSSGPSTLIFKRGPKVFALTMKRTKIKLKPFTERGIHESGYMALGIITPGIDQKLLSAAEEFKNQGKRFLFLDLRNCLGGDVPTAARIAGFFLSPGDLLYVEETHKEKIPFHNSVKAHISLPLAILTSSSTGSAAELITGALHDHGRAKIYGEPTLGKGYIQTTWRLRDGSEIRFTTARYLTPNGSSIGQEGIIPDYTYHWEKDLDRQLDAIFTSLQH